MASFLTVSAKSGKRSGGWRENWTVIARGSKVTRPCVNLLIAANPVDFMRTKYVPLLRLTELYMVGAH